MILMIAQLCLKSSRSWNALPPDDTISGTLKRAQIYIQLLSVSNVTLLTEILQFASRMIVYFVSLILHTLSSPSLSFALNLYPALYPTVAIQIRA